MEIYIDQQPEIWGKHVYMYMYLDMNVHVVCSVCVCVCVCVCQVLHHLVLGPLLCLYVKNYVNTCVILRDLKSFDFLGIYFLNTKGAFEQANKHTVDGFDTTSKSA